MPYTYDEAKRLLEEDKEIGVVIGYKKGGVPVYLYKCPVCKRILEDKYYNGLLRRIKVHNFFYHAPKTKKG